MTPSESLPDVRDGLTSLQRLAFRAVASAGPTLTRSSRVVANAASRKPHFERLDLYRAIVELAATWTQRYPLVEGTGNLGSVEGDAPAASPFTEVHASAVTAVLVSELDDPAPAGITPLDRRASAILLPGPFPQLLANGADASGSAFPSHNLREVAAAVAIRIDDPDCSLDAVLAVMPGPDLATGGTIVDGGAIRALYEAGHGTLRIRGDAGSEAERRYTFAAALDGEARTFTLLDVIDEYIAHRRVVIERRDVLERRAAELAEDQTPGTPLTHVTIGDLIKVELGRVAEEFGDDRRTTIASS